MSIAAQTALALGRAVFIAGAAVAISGWLSGALRGRKLAWALLLAPFLTPPLLISYALSKFALVASPWGREALYVGVLALKLIPVAVIARVLVPSPLSAEARHCHAMFAAPSLSFRIRAAGSGPWIAGALVFILAFADFELASLWSVKTWTVAIFDAQTGGLALPETLRLAALPLAIAFTTLALVARLRPGISSPGIAPATRAPLIFLAASALLVCAVPLGFIAWQAAGGFAVLAENFVLTRELTASLLFALAAATAAQVLARTSRLPAAIPGLLGALIVSLLILALFQIPPLRFAYDTPLPLVLALTIILLPLALLLRALLQRPTPALHIARQIGSGRLLWELEKRPRFAAFALLFCWAYFDFTASSILAPVGMTPVFVRLHNLAHYGQTAVLSAMMLAAFAAPVALLLLTGAAARIHTRRNGR